MPEELLDVLGLWTLREEQRGAGVPQVVDRIRGKPARLRSEANESLCKLFGLLRVPTSLAKTRGARSGASCSADSREAMDCLRTNLVVRPHEPAGRRVR